ncbi:MAG: hypothetical protein HN368_15835 [Spirochaetales bacterium]|jgi:Kef-type K+ transport system membrane component KefB|nr:hypothetical protein [Spirochaetales bacterium]
MIFLHNLQSSVFNLGLPTFLVIGILAICAYFAGNAARRIRFPSIIGFMIMGVVLGPSLLNIVSEHILSDLSFLTTLALSFVAVSIGLELNFGVLKSQGKAVASIILGESLIAFLLVFLAVYLISGDIVIAILFGSIAPPSAPAGTVAVIQEYKARGPLTNTLYAVVGFDDGLGIVIFGFASAFAFSILGSETGAVQPSILKLIGEPFLEIGASIVVGGIMSLLFSLLARKRRSVSEVLILLVTFLFLSTGVCEIIGLSYILANMVLGIVVVNTQSGVFVQKIRDALSPLMPLLFLLFFGLAGANLHLAALPAVGLIGAAYILARSAGKIGGATLGAFIGKASSNLKKYAGIGILSQAGVAIGLSLVLKQELLEFGSRGEEIGAVVLTTITATSIVFEIVGPVLAKVALKRSGEIQVK